MTYLPSLIKKIDNFYSLAASLERLNRFAAPPQAWTMPDDEEYEEEDQPDGLEGEDTGLYSKVMGTADDLSNEKNSYKYEDIANEIRLIAELYKKALQINGGFAQVQNYIKRTMANIDMLIDESEGSVGDDVRDMSDDIIEEMSSDLRRRAKAIPITQQTDESKAKKELEAVKDRFNREEAREEMESQKSVYEKGKPGAETGHVIVKKTAETPQKYAREIARLKESFQTETDPANRQNIEALARTLIQLIEQMKTVKKLEGDVKITPDDPSVVESFKQATVKLDELRRQRFVLRRNINNLLLKDDKKKMIEQQQASRNPEQRKWLQQKIELLDLRLDDKLLRKRDEIKARKALINSMGVIDDHGDFQSLKIPENERMALDRGVMLGRDRTLSKDKYDRIQTVERAKSHGKIGDVSERTKGRAGGGRKYERINQYDVGRATFSGLVDKLSEKINTSAHVARLNVTQEIGADKKNIHNALKPYVDALSKAIQKKNTKAKYEAIKVLKQQMTAWAARAPAIRALEKNVRLLPHFNKLKGELENISGWKSPEGGWQLSPDQKSYIASVMNGAERLIEMYARYYMGQGAPAGASQLSISFDNTVKYLGMVLDQLANETGVTATGVIKPENVQYRVETPSEGAPEELEEAPEERAQNKMQMPVRNLANLLDKEYLFKLAQEAGKEEVDAATADRLADEIFDKLFDQTLEETGIKQLLA
jgi:hypothetical protein